MKKYSNRKELDNKELQFEWNRFFRIKNIIDGILPTMAKKAIILKTKGKVMTVSEKDKTKVDFDKLEQRVKVMGRSFGQTVEKLGFEDKNYYMQN